MKTIGKTDKRIVCGILIMAGLAIIGGSLFLLKQSFIPLVAPNIESQDLSKIRMEKHDICLGLNVSLPIRWRIENRKDSSLDSSMGISYEANINKQSWRILDGANRIQLEVNCFQPMKIDDVTKQIKSKLSIEEAVEILRPIKELSNFRNVKYGVSSVNQKQCAHFEQWALSSVRCRLPIIGCGKAPGSHKAQDIFICSKEGNQSTGAFIYEIIQYHQALAEAENLLNKVFESISF